uniref:(northern house mosquito) hypothetical protein n=1 Tax=Culex pipiens TaxID=7175 RepID=A0A8D8N2C7_CULPI
MCNRSVDLKLNTFEQMTHFRSDLSAGSSGASSVTTNVPQAVSSRDPVGESGFSSGSSPMCTGSPPLASIAVGDAAVVVVVGLWVVVPGLVSLYILRSIS